METIMNFINTVLGVPLGYVMYFCYELAGSYGWAIILFTFAAKLVMFPVSLVSQKNSIKMVKLQPQLDDIKQRYFDNKDAAAEEQMKLFKKEKYNPYVGCAPLILQIPLIMGLLNVIYNPLQHILRIEQQTIDLLTAKFLEFSGMSPGSSGVQMGVLKAIQEDASVFEPLRAVIGGFDGVIERIQGLDLNFLGFNLSGIPSFASILILIPILSGLSAVIMCIAQNKLNVLQQNQTALSKWGMTIFMLLFSSYFAFVVPAGIGMYWIAGNLLAILVMVICNMIYNPKKYIDQQNKSKKAVLTKEEKREARAKAKVNHVRAKADSKRFFAVEDKQLVFYSESGGFYKYFGALIDYVTANSDIVVHYVTSDPEDKIFEDKNEQIQKYYVGNRELIAFMMKMDADMVVMTLPDLEQYHIKRSLVRKDVEYVYTDHGMGSFHLMLRKGALDHFDTIFCYGPNHIEEVRQTEEFYKLPKKKLVNTGFWLLDLMLEKVAELEETENAVKKILIAPSWQKDNIMEICLDGILEQLLDRGYCVTVRPHPEFVKRFSARMNAITTKYKDRLGEDFIINTDFSSNFDVYSSDLVITDWSSIAQEFSFATKKPSLHINTPMKIMNPEYRKIKAEPVEISMRENIGVSVDLDKFDTLPEVVAELIAKKDEYRDKITEVLNGFIFNIGHSAEFGGKYIIETLDEKKAKREEERAKEMEQFSQE